jgi:hypothetical protein
MLANLANLAYSADGTLVLGVVLGAVKRALLECGAAVDGGVTRGTDVKLGKLIEFNVDRVVGVPLALRLHLLGLQTIWSELSPEYVVAASTYILNNLAGSAVGDDPVSEAQSRIVVLVSYGKLHCAQQRKLSVRHLDLRNCEVSRQFQAPLELVSVLGQGFSIA